MYKHLAILVTVLLFSLTVRPVQLAKNTAITHETSGYMSLNDRAKNPWVNTVFKKNILLTLSYLSQDGKTAKAAQILPNKYHYEIVLQPNEVFAFHHDVLPKYHGKVIKTTHATFNYAQGFYNDGLYYGDGVCHLASLINKTATKAGLVVEAPTNHNFMPIPDIEKQYGTSIFYTPGRYATNALHNLYITNTFNKPVHISFEYKNDSVAVRIQKEG